MEQKALFVFLQKRGSKNLDDQCMSTSFTDYTLKISTRAKRMRLAVHYDGRCIVTVPKYIPRWFVEHFVNQKSQWILDKIAHFNALTKTGTIMKSTRTKYIKNKEQARILIEKKIQEFNSHYKFIFNDIRIKNQKTCWGSCSKKGNLNFNYKIAALPEKLVDYIVVHEICHLGELNHSKRFWDLVAQKIPDYRERRRELKKIKIF